jgi:hypothetical protein
MAIAAEAVSPGMAPTIMPIIAAARTQSINIGFVMTPASALKISIS